MRVQILINCVFNIFHASQSSFTQRRHNNIIIIVIFTKLAQTQNFNNNNVNSSTCGIEIYMIGRNHYSFSSEPVLWLWIYQCLHIRGTKHACYSLSSLVQIIGLYFSYPTKWSVSTDVILNLMSCHDYHRLSAKGTQLLLFATLLIEELSLIGRIAYVKT